MDSAPAAAAGAAFAAFDLLATLVAVVRPDARVLHANATFENLLGVPRRAMLATALTDWLADPQPLRETLAAVSENRIATGRFEAVLRRPAGTQPTELLPVHVIVNQTDHPDRVLVLYPGALVATYVRRELELQRLLTPVMGGPA